MQAPRQARELDLSCFVWALQGEITTKMSGIVSGRRALGHARKRAEAPVKETPPDESTFSVDCFGPRPYFAEIPYALWGDVNYDSEGDCTKPTDRSWTWMYLLHRDTRARVDLSSDDPRDSAPLRMTIRSLDPALAARTASFLIARCGGKAAGEDPRPLVGEGFSLDKAMADSQWVREQFARPELSPFDNELFWGSFKRRGPVATEYTWVGRWILTAVLERDPRGVSLCVDWLEAGPFSPLQSVALRIALEGWTGERFDTDKAWVDWYKDGPGQLLFPEPDFDRWYNEQLAAAGLPRQDA